MYISNIEDGSYILTPGGAGCAGTTSGLEHWELTSRSSANTRTFHPDD